MKRLPVLVATIVLTLLAPVAGAQDDLAQWPERHRHFYQDGPGFLLNRAQLAEFLGASDAERDDFIERFLADPLPETPENELVEGIDLRRRLVRLGAEKEGEYLSPHDVRAQLLFLQGVPSFRRVVECGQAFKPMEIWAYGPPEAARAVVLYKPRPNLPFKLWLPIDSKRVLYTREMEYWLQQYEELKRYIRGKRFDLQACPDTPMVDDATGIDGLFGFRPGRPRDEDLKALLEAPADLAAWAGRAAATDLPAAPAELAVESFDIYFPDRVGQRIVARFFVTLPEDVQLERWQEGDKEELRIVVEGIIEQDGEVFDDLRVLFTLEPPDEPVALALAVESALRPNRDFVVRLRVADQVGGGEAIVRSAFTVPTEPIPIEEPPVPDDAIVALGQQIAETRIPGHDSLMLVPPETDVVIGLWRAEALVTGARISEVVFLVDEEPQLTRKRPPFSAELRLAKYPTEQVIRAEGYDAEGELVAADDVVVNQPTGALRVRILEPMRGVAVGERVAARAEVVVPEDRRVDKVDFLVDDQLVASLESPPWQTEIIVPQSNQLSYMTVLAVLDDGSRAEDVRFLNAPQYLEEVEVNLVELYTTVTDKTGRIVKGLGQDAFKVFEDKRPQEISKFELVEDLPLTLAITIDTSGSMVASLPEARAAAKGFLENIITPRDRYFAIAFSDRPVLIMSPTDDVRAVEGSLDGLQSVGMTTLHDAVVTTLYYFRGVRGRRAMILLSDGDDTASSIPYRDALEYAKRSGVAIYTIGLDVGSLKSGVRRKLNQMSEETGGRSFYIKSASELKGVYDDIEDELRSQYLLAYSSDKPATEGEYREVEVQLVDKKLKARTIRGYYP